MEVTRSIPANSSPASKFSITFDRARAENLRKEDDVNLVLTIEQEMSGTDVLTDKPVRAVSKLSMTVLLSDWMDICQLFVDKNFT